MIRTRLISVKRSVCVRSFYHVDYKSILARFSLTHFTVSLSTSGRDVGTLGRLTSWKTPTLRTAPGITRLQRRRRLKNTVLPRPPLQTCQVKRGSEIRPWTAQVPKLHRWGPDLCVVVANYSRVRQEGRINIYLYSFQSEASEAVSSLGSSYGICCGYRSCSWDTTCSLGLWTPCSTA